MGRNTLETLLFRGLSTPVALLLVVLQGRFLHPSGRGAFVLAVLGVTIVSRLLGQLGSAVTSRVSEQGVNLRPLVQRALGTALVLGVAGMGLIVGWAAVSGDVGVRLAALAALGLIPNLVWQTISGVLLGLARVRLWNYIQLLPPALTLVGIAVLVVGLDRGVRGAVVAWTLANALTAAFALAATRDLWLPLRLPRLADEHGRAILRLALLMGAVQVVNLISYRVELYILRRYEGLGEVGIYSVAMQAAEAMWLIPAAVATAVAPVLHETDSRAAQLIRRAAGRALILTAAAALAVGLLAPFAIPLIFGEAFDGAASALALLLPGVVAYAPVTILVVYLSLRCGRPRLSLAVSLVAMGLTLASAFVLIPGLGSRGAALASTVGYLGGTALAWMLFVRVARGRAAVVRAAV